MAGLSFRGPSPGHMREGPSCKVIPTQWFVRPPPDVFITFALLFLALIGVIVASQVLGGILTRL